MEIRNKRLEGPNEGGRVSCSLTHSIGTATLYYQAPSQTDSISTFMTIQSLINGREGRSPDIGQDGAEGPMTHTSVRFKGKSKASNSTPEQRQISPQSVPQVRRVMSPMPEQVIFFHQLREELAKLWLELEHLNQWHCELTTAVLSAGIIVQYIGGAGRGSLTATQRGIVPFLLLRVKVQLQQMREKAGEFDESLLNIFLLFCY